LNIKRKIKIDLKTAQLSNTDERNGWIGLDFVKAGDERKEKED